MGKLFDKGDPSGLTFKDRMKLFTWPVALASIVCSLAMFNFGYDMMVFGGVIAMPYFNMKFGEPLPNGKYVIPGEVISIMNAVPFAGKLVGIWCAAPLAQWVGRKPIFAVIIVLSWVGVCLQIAADHWGVFTAGRVICYGMTGVCATVLPTYIAETSPKELRGLLVAQMHFQIALGQIIASGINTATSDMMSHASWMIPIGLQLMMPTIMAFGYWWLTESPRWYLAKGKRDKAVAALTKLRGRFSTPEAIDQEIEELWSSDANKEKGTWKEMIQGTNLRRTGIAVLAMSGQQATGQTFISQYGILFYTAMGFENAYELGLIAHALALIMAAVASLFVDHIGRRPLLMLGGFGQAIFLFVVGGVGTVRLPPWPLRRLSVAGMMLWAVCFSLSWAPLSYIIMSEASSARVVEKTNLVAVTVTTVIAFIVSLTTPFLISPEYAGLGGMVGFIYGGIALVMVVLAWCFVPEMNGRSLEELNELFEQRTPTRKFKHAVVDVPGACATPSDSASSSGDSEKREEAGVAGHGNGGVLGQGTNV